MENKSNHKNFVHLVGLYTYFGMMHGAYNVKLNLYDYVYKLLCYNLFINLLLGRILLSYFFGRELLKPGRQPSPECFFPFLLWTK